MRIHAFSTDLFVLPLPEGHRFPMEKYRLLRESISDWPAIQLSEPPAATDDQLLLAHTERYVRALITNQLSQDELKAIGFPWSPQMVERSRRSTGATLAAAQAAWSAHQTANVPLAFNLAGGTHHAGADRGEGFCCFNDAAVTARVMQRDHGVSRVAILDLDVHQGNGTAEIFQRDSSVVTVSVHGENNYPFEKPRSDLDIGLEDGTTDAPYLAAVDEALTFLERAGLPELLIYLAGADPLVNDRLGRLAISAEGLKERDRRVFEWAKRHQVATAVAMAGGYARPIEHTVAVHRQTIATAITTWIPSR